MPSDTFNIDGLGEIKEIKECEIIHKAYHHSVCSLEVRIEKERISQFYGKTDSKITVTEKNTNKLVPLFRGFVTEIDTTNGYDGFFTVKALSYSAKTDIKRNNRVFQDTKKKLSDIVSLTAKDSKDNLIVHTDNLEDDMSFENPVIQYQETDFEFIKRLAMTAKCAVFSECSDKPSVFIGNKIGNASNVFNIIEKGVVSCVHKKWIYDYARENFTPIFTVTSNKFFEFGKDILFDGNKYVIFNWKYNYRNRADRYTYEFCKEGNIPCELAPVPPQRIYLEAKVTSISDNDNLGRIEVEFADNDFKELGSGEKFKIPFRTPYTAGDRGIVFLPEEGDIVEVVYSRGTFFSGSVIRKKQLDSDVQKVDKNKHIMVYNNRLTFNEDSVEICRKHGNDCNTITIDDDSIMLKIGDSSIEMKNDSITFSVSDAKIKIVSDRIEIDGNKTVDLKSSGSINIESSKIVMKK